MKTLVIDWGTYYIHCAVTQRDSVKLVGEERNDFFPSDVCVVSSNHIAVGAEASSLRGKYPEYFDSGFLRYINEPMEINGVGYLQIVCAFVKHLVKQAEVDIYKLLFVLQHDMFDSRDITDILERATYSAGIKNVQFMPESVGIWHNYVSTCKLEPMGKTLTYSLGSSMFECAVIANDDIQSTIEPICTSKATIGGQDIDECLFRKAQACAENNGTPLDEDNAFLDFEKCRNLKEILSNTNTASVTLSNTFRFELSRGELEQLSEPIFNTTFDTIDKMLSCAGIHHNDIKRIVLAGGTANMPITAIRLQKHFCAYGAYDVEIISSDKNLAFVCCKGAALSERQQSEDVPRLIFDGKEYLLSPEITSIGRGEDQNIVIPVDNHQRFSRHHFDITIRKNRKQQSYFLQNHSAQMTFVGGMCVGAFGCNELEIKDNDIITAGKLRFVFRTKS